jgi:mRNA interferase RelE/StbE
VGDYSIEFDRRVKRDLKSVPTQEMERIKAAISNLSSNPRPSGCKKLKGKNQKC